MDELETAIVEKKEENVVDKSDNTKTELKSEEKGEGAEQVKVALEEAPKNSSEVESKVALEEAPKNSSEVESKVAASTDEPGEQNSEKVETGDKTKQHNDKAKNRSDIFSLNENKNLPSMIFSVGGAHSKIIHKTDHNSTDDGVNTSRHKQFRNPLTGFGVCSKDEFKTKPSKRKDGNPLLGIGYKDDDEFFNTQPTQKIPPGGHSKGLW